METTRTSLEDTRSRLAINDLPLEILSSILLFVPHERRQPRQTPTEVRLSHVCSTWRAAALLTPSLWTDVFIYSKRSAIAAAAYIRRSGTALPLNIRVDIYAVDKANGNPGRGNGSKTLALVASVRTLLFPVLHRTKSLLVFSYWKYTMDRLLDILSGSAPQLERFRAICANTEVDVPIPQQQQAQAVVHTAPPSPPLFPGGMPAIQYLETDLPDSIQPSAVAKVTTLHLNNPSPSTPFEFAQFTTILQTTAKSLVTLSLQGAFNTASWPVDVSMTRFELPQLRHLRFRDDSAMMVKFLFSVSAPALEALWIEATVPGQPFGLLAASSQFQGTTKFPQLRYLTIPSYNFNFIEFLVRAFPTINHLNVPHANFNHHAKKLTEVLNRGWGTVETVVMSLPREKQMETMLDTLLGCNRVKHILVDADTLRLVRTKHGSHAVAKRMKELKEDVEPWWLGVAPGRFDDI